MLLVIRHAVAGERAKWRDHPDERRPLSGRGRKQAKALVKQHAKRPVDRLLSSPYDRCTETLEPLAAARGLKVDVHPALEEGASWEALHALLLELHDVNAALCTHGDMIQLLVGHLDELGLKKAKKPEWKKSSTWVLHTTPMGFRKAVYKEPPR